MILTIILTSIICSIFYRAGGMSRLKKHWIPVWLRKSGFRDWGCPLCFLLPTLFIHVSWWLLLAYILSGLALTTYWDDLNGQDNFWIAGLVCGIAGIPLFFYGFPILPILIRAVVLCVSWGLIAKLSSNDFFEEYSRGFMLSITMLFLLMKGVV